MTNVFRGFDDDQKILKRARKKPSNPHHIPMSTGAGIGSMNTNSGIGSIVDTADLSLDDLKDDFSFTYSASSSQAGESTDSTDSSSIADITEKRFENPNNFSRENSVGTDSMVYSEDGESLTSEYYRQVNVNANVNGATIPGQPSGSHGHDGGRLPDDVTWMPANNNHHNHPYQQHNHHQHQSSHHHHNSNNNNNNDFHQNYNYNQHRQTPTSSSSRHNHISKTPNSSKQRYTHKSSSPRALTSPATVVTSDLSLGSNGTGTPHTPPPRHAAQKQLRRDQEVLYSKWWMCGFPDAFNFNSKC